MKFSILVPVYNVEKYLHECVDSLLSQTFIGEYEIILVDDGSTDSSGKICDEYAKISNKIKVIHKENEGPVAARNVAISNAIGEYCLFVDSDDFLELNTLEIINQCLLINPNTDAVVFTFNYYRNKTKTPKLPLLSDKEMVYTKENKIEIYNAFLSSTLLNSLWTKAVKTEIIKNDSTDFEKYASKKMAEDLFVTLYHMTQAKKIVYIKEHLYNYRVEDTSFSRSYKPIDISKKNTLFVYDRFREYLPIWGLEDEEHIQKLNARWFNEAMYTFSCYYENCSGKDRKAVLAFDWDSMLPEEAKKDRSNIYENKSYQKLYTWIKEKKHKKIHAFFLNKKLYKTLKINKTKIFH